MSTDYTPGERLWLTADGKVVKDGDPNAATLLTGGPDDTIPLEQAVELGLATGDKSAAEPAVEAEPEDAEAKQAEDVEDKQATAPANKRRTSRRK